jgi:hypothetical protein
LKANSNKIVDTLGHYGLVLPILRLQLDVTLYEIIPDAGVRISKIKNLEDDISLALALWEFILHQFQVKEPLVLKFLTKPRNGTC